MFLVTMVLGASVWAAPIVQVKPIGTTHASDIVQCALGPVTSRVPVSGKDREHYSIFAHNPGSARYTVIAWNDLGMHCVDGKDYSIFSILPPFNNLHAQVANASTGKVVSTGVTLTYEAVDDPAGSINTTSSNKTNFWAWVGALYGASPTVDIGLTGNRTPSRVAQPMVFNATNGWFEATGLPITSYDDVGTKNFYPTVKVTALDSTGRVVAKTTVVLPVSDEMTCSGCHSSRPTTETNRARIAAKPLAGWINDPNPEKDWKKNILPCTTRSRPATQSTLPRSIRAA